MQAVLQYSNTQLPRALRRRFHPKSLSSAPALSHESLSALLIFGIFAVLPSALIRSGGGIAMGSSFNMRKFSATAGIGFFKSRKLSPTELLETVLKDKQTARQGLVRRLDTAEMFVTDKREAGERLALDGASDQALGRAEAATRAAEDRARTLRAALAQLDEQIAEIERELRTAVERRYRDSVADWLEARAAAIAQAGPAYDAGSFALIEAVTKSAAALPEASSLAADLEAMRREVATVVERISAELRTAATRTRQGEARIAFQAPPPSPPEIEREAISATSQSAASMSETSAVGSAPQASSATAGSVEKVDVSDNAESEASKPAPEQADASFEETMIKHDAAA